MRRCTEKSTKKKLAAKFITVNRIDDRQEVEREVDIMRSLQHPRLLQLYDAFDDGKTQMCLIMEWSVYDNIFLIHLCVYIEWFDTFMVLSSNCMIASKGENCLKE